MSCFGGFDFSVWITVVWAALKPVAWGLGVLAEKTENKWDNGIARAAAKAVSYFGWLAGTFGIGDVPKSVKHRPSLKK